MALKKQIQSRHGVVGDYWKVVELAYFAPGQLTGTPTARGLDISKAIVVARLGLFKDQAAADENASTLEKRKFFLEVDLKTNNLVKQVYAHIKANDADLGEADDVLEEE